VNTSSTRDNKMGNNRNRSVTEKKGTLGGNFELLLVSSLEREEGLRVYRKKGAGGSNEQ